MVIGMLIKNPPDFTFSLYPMSRSEVIECDTDRLIHIRF